MEDTQRQIGGNNEYLHNRSAVKTPEEFSDRFEELLEQGHSWINLNATGIIGDSLLITIETPKYKNNCPREKVAINVSGPFNHRGWDVTSLVRFID